MPRFVILTHDHPFLHWDLMLSTGDTLRTFRLHAPPTEGNAIRAEALPDHRLAYLDYEGPVSGGRGTVSRWDAGAYELLSATPTQFEIDVSGRRLQGRFRLEKTAESDDWSFQRSGD